MVYCALTHLFKTIDIYTASAVNFDVHMRERWMEGKSERGESVSSWHFSILEIYKIKEEPKCGFLFLLVK